MFEDSEDYSFRKSEIVECTQGTSGSKRLGGSLKEMEFQIRHINYPLVEDVRPPIYAAMKYWGKKPGSVKFLRDGLFR